MVQAQVELTDEQFKALENLANQRRMSVADLLQESIDQLLHAMPSPTNQETRQRALAAAGRFRSSLGDLSSKHDEYLATDLSP